MTLTVESVSKQVLDLIRNDSYTAVAFWQSLDGDNLIQYHSSLGRSIRNQFGLWAEGALEDGVHPDDLSQRVIEAVYAEVKTWDADAIAAENNGQGTEIVHFDDLNEDEFELVGGDLAALESTYPTLSAETVSAMKEFEWVHANGTKYAIVEVTNIDADVERRAEYPLTVVYRNLETNQVWSKPLAAFHAKMSRGGRLE